MPSAEERNQAIGRLHSLLVQVDNGILNLGGRLSVLRKEDPHGIISRPDRLDVTSTKIEEVQSRIAIWVDPICATVGEAKRKAVGISHHVVSIVEDPVAFETDLHANLRILDESLHALPYGLGSKTDEQQVVSLGMALHIQGARLQDGLAALSAGGPKEVLAAATYMSVGDLAKMYGLDQERLRKRLERERAKNHDCYREIDSGERKPHDPKYLYCPEKVQHIIDAMKQG